MYSYQIELAIRAASVLHKDQVRRGDAPLPYITHIIAVAQILSDYTDDEDTLVAAFLHDTVEDTDYTLDELEEDFGKTVRDIVATISEPADKPWLERKKQYIKQLKKGSEPALMICAADKIHNMRTATEEYYDDHTRFLADFGGTLEERVQWSQTISNILNSQLKNDIVHEFNHVFTEYKNFIENVQRQET